MRGRSFFFLNVSLSFRFFLLFYLILFFHIANLYCILIPYLPLPFTLYIMMLYSYPVANANKSMHPLLLPKINSVTQWHPNKESIPVFERTDSPISHPNSVTPPLELSTFNENNDFSASSRSSSRSTITANASASPLNFTIQKPMTPPESIDNISNGFKKSKNSQKMVKPELVKNNNTSTSANKQVVVLVNSPTDHSNVDSTLLTLEDLTKGRYYDSDKHSNNDNQFKTQLKIMRMQSTSNLYFNNKKRQRIGPSCDSCRSKKVRCDARIEILCQSESVVNLISDKLHYKFKENEVSDICENFLHNDELTKEILDKENSIELIKHLDKIVLLHPCTTCSKLKNKKKYILHNNLHHSCSFSKGLTRADINIFSRISKMTNKKRISEMTIVDYANAGFR